MYRRVQRRRQRGRNSAVKWRWLLRRTCSVKGRGRFQKAGEHGLGLLHWDRRPCAQRSARRSGHVSEDYLDTAKHIAKQCGTCLLRTKRSYDFCAVMPGLNSSPNPSWMWSWNWRLRKRTPRLDWMTRANLSRLSTRNGKLFIINWTPLSSQGQRWFWVS